MTGPAELGPEPFSFRLQRPYLQQKLQKAPVPPNQGALLDTALVHASATSYAG